MEKKVKTHKFVYIYLRCLLYIPIFHHTVEDWYTYLFFYRNTFTIFWSDIIIIKT